MITIWHNPRCSKSRNALAAITGFDHVVRRYLEDTPSEAEIKTALSELGFGAKDLLRAKEPLAKEMDLKDASEASIIQAMARHPILIERPVIFAQGKAIIARDPDALSAFLATL